MTQTLRARPGKAGAEETGCAGEQPAYSATVKMPGQAAIEVYVGLGGHLVICQESGPGGVGVCPGLVALTPAETAVVIAVLRELLPKARALIADAHARADAS